MTDAERGEPTAAQLASWLNAAKLLDGRARMLRASIRTQCGEGSALRGLADVACIEAQKLRGALEPKQERITEHDHNAFPNGRWGGGK